MELPVESEGKISSSPYNTYRSYVTGSPATCRTTRDNARRSSRWMAPRTHQFGTAKDRRRRRARSGDARGGIGFSFLRRVPCRLRGRRTRCTPSPFRNVPPRLPPSFAVDQDEALTENRPTVCETLTENRRNHPIGTTVCRRGTGQQGFPRPPRPARRPTLGILSAPRTRGRSRAVGTRVP